MTKFRQDYVKLRSYTSKFLSLFIKCQAALSCWDANIINFMQNINAIEYVYSFIISMKHHGYGTILFYFYIVGENVSVYSHQDLIEQLS